MTFQVGTLNAVLNALLLAVHAVLVLLTEHTYLSCARLQAHRRGATSATDSSQLRVSHWLLSGLRRLWRVRPAVLGGRGATADDGAVGLDAALDGAPPRIGGGGAAAPGGGGGRRAGGGRAPRRGGPGRRDFSGNGFFRPQRRGPRLC